MELPVGYYQFHKNSFFNYQLNRWYSLGYTVKEEIEQIGSKIETFSDYVNDIRIGNACQQLTESDKTIGEIAFDSGFESLTYFNRVFLKKKSATPRAFRNDFTTKTL